MGTYPLPLPLQNNHCQFTPSLFSPPHVIWTINYYYISLHCKAAATENVWETKRSTWYNIVLRKLTVIHLFIKIYMFVKVNNQIHSIPLQFSKPHFSKIICNITVLSKSRIYVFKMSCPHDTVFYKQNIMLPNLAIPPLFQSHSLALHRGWQ